MSDAARTDGPPTSAPRRRARCARRRALGAVAGAALVAAPLGASLAPRTAGAEMITGVCPDGSIFIVRSEAQVPCRESKRVTPDEVPPIRPQYLPRPYTWDVWSRRQDPNNPYNLIDAAREVRELRGSPTGARPAPGGTATPGGPGGPGGDAAAGAAPGPGGTATGAPVTAAVDPRPGVATPTLPDRPLDLGLSDEELRSLFQIVELSQESLPVQFARNTADGRGVFRVALARSKAFEARLREAWASRGGLGGSSVLLFTAVSRRAADFHANFTFVQGHLTYQPDARNARQLGILQGRLGSLAGGEAVLGYVVLPETIDPGADLDVYWNDRRTSARFPR